MTTKAKLISGLVAIFAAGLVVGGTAGFKVAEKNAPKPPPVEVRGSRGDRGGRPPSASDFAKHMCSKQQKDLDLSDEQLTKIKPIYDQASVELKDIHAENDKRVRAIFRAADQQIRAFLTPEQIEKLDQKNREREEKRRQRSEKPPKC